MAQTHGKNEVHRNLFLPVPMYGTVGMCRSRLVMRLGDKQPCHNKKWDGTVCVWGGGAILVKHSGTGRVRLIRVRMIHKIR